ncbi:OmpH family outer membrane protein [Subsaximicrobium wynnwilliamsii]|jgi:outer membrane protein|uniref:OmpH family outer membrane protein n=1 Tax=Subsaximicrobium wynnwilliamsii TaxID=291179 RepID=A0A5C6ZIT8_9FLAO|nr:OmpH family outer membrane protein [Subsaximicrobium wynnwilliamsii]TXD83983.1 OmpH family outer membrane protein [Subsaximicrobium wynnwilliamsii]TXD89723.1 OmpH family outer membrane protein [Subsaximicrobium wynnwilliamsii]TXE01708.1 OmpH family outer membrane protein [Subsaximicrobium wynnwilliamsii]
MRKLVGLFSVALILASCQEQQKIAFVNNGEVINAYTEKIEIEAKYEKMDADFQKRTDSIGQAFQTEAQDFQTKAANMSQQEQQEQYQVLGQKQQRLQQQIQQEQQQLGQKFNVEIDSAMSHVKQFVTDYGKENGYTFILGKNEAGSVMYGEEAKDISKEIIEALNADYKKAE